jgi:hypothetical protein
MSMKTIRPWIPATLIALAFVTASTFLVHRSVSAETAERRVEASANLGSMGITTGPDVTIIHISGIQNHGADGSIRGYSLGTDSCNIGSEPVNWCDDSGCVGDIGGTEKHPVIGQNLYRLRDGRFEQIGMSWLKHGFLSTNSFDPDCVGNNGSDVPTTCVSPPSGSDQLGVGCTDFYSSGLNGNRPLGRRSEVNPTTGLFPFPPTGGGSTGNTGQRIRVDESDLSGVGDRFWVEGHYIADNDAVGKNGLNNASYREVTVNTSSFNISEAGPTVREQAAIFAWAAADNGVEVVNADLVSSIPERFHAARRVSDIGGGMFRYVFAIHNMNSDRAARSFSVDFPGATAITNVGFHDVEHHSGEPFATTDWVSAVDGPNGTVTWSTDTFAVDPDANALRWGTMFTFWFDADVEPTGATHTLGLFKSGSPSEIAVPFADVGATLVFDDSFEGGNTAEWDVVTP